MTRRLAALLAFALALAPAVLAGCGGGDEGGGEAAPPPAETAPEPAPPPAEPEGDSAAGEAVWSNAGCGNCHVLAAAGSTGVVGPDLDVLRPDFDATVEQVTNGGGGMPAFADTLSEQEILDVSAYVVASTSG
jgi:mono/diheme cytochrome c family protein